MSIILKKFLLIINIIIVLIFMLFIIIGCSVESNNDRSQETEIRLQPIMIPDGRGHLHLTMMPRTVTKGE